MKLIIEGQEIEYENSIEIIDSLMEDIYDILKDNSKLLNSLEIDGEEIYLNYGDYIFRNINNIENIEVKSITIGELIEDTLMSTLDYINNALPVLEKINISSSSSHISDLVEGLTWIFETFLYIDKDPNLNARIERKEEWNLYAKEIYELSALVPDLLKAEEIKDDILFNSTIDKIIDLFKKMESSILEIIRID